MIIYNGIETFPAELGKSIGDVDITNIRFFTTGSKSMWEMLGFENENNFYVSQGHPGNPDSTSYWKKIIPKDYSIFERGGIFNTGGSTANPNYIITPEITSNEQYWNVSGLYNYPVLPKHGADGMLKIPFEYPYAKVKFPESGPITEEDYTDDNLQWYRNISC